MMAFVAEGYRVPYLRIASALLALAVIACFPVSSAERSTSPFLLKFPSLILNVNTKCNEKAHFTKFELDFFARNQTSRASLTVAFS